MTILRVKQPPLIGDILVYREPNDIMLYQRGKYLPLPPDERLTQFLMLSSCEDFWKGNIIVMQENLDYLKSAIFEVGGE